ncbi:MAG: diacylglycerol kinase family protein [Candidatus Izemoplasma sp.]
MYLILYNPLSKNNKGNINTHKLIKEFKTKNIPFRIKSIIKIDDLELYLSGKEHITKIILLGGDGTINRFVNDTIDMNIKQDIYLKRNGTGNDFLRSLKIDDSLPQKIMQVTFDNGEKTYFINGTGMGIDGRISDLVNNAPKKGKFRYFQNTLKALATFNPTGLNVEIDGVNHYFKKAYLINLSNGKFFGGGMKISPNANLDDDYLDVTIAHTINKLFIAFIFLTVYLGKHTSFKKFIFNAKGKHIKATFDAPQSAQCDGENYYNIRSFDVKSSGKTIHLRYYDK